MKGLWLLLCMAVPRAGYAEVISLYENPESLVEDFEQAMSGVTSPDGLLFPLAAYYSCRALEEGTPAVCARLDPHLSRLSENTPSCRRLFHQTRMIRDAVGGTGAVDSCVELALLSEVGRPDADSREEAASFCRKLAPLYEKGDPQKVCDFMHAEDGVYGEDPRTDRPISRLECVRENAFLSGEPGACDPIGDPQGRRHCRAKAVLVKSVRDKSPAPSGCASVREGVLAQYESLRRRPGAYDRPEALTEALGSAAPTEGLLYLLSDYFACSAFRIGDVGECDKIDALMRDRGNPTDVGGSHCREQHFQGRMILEALDGLGSSAACRDGESSEHGDPAVCPDLMAAYAKGDADDICAVIHRDDETMSEREDRKRCKSHHLGLAGSVEACDGLEGYMRTRCQGVARFVRALKTRTPGEGLSTVYAPLLRRGASCAGPGRLALREYEKMRAKPAVPAAVREHLSEYHACLAFRDGTDARCAGGAGDSDDIGGSHCREEYFQGRMILESLEGKGAIDSCLRSETTEGEPAEEARSFCKALAAAYGKGDPRKICDTIDEEEKTLESQRRCLDHHSGLSGDAQSCARLTDPLVRSRCESRAALVRAIKEGKPELASSTHYAPLVDPKASCDSPESISARIHHGEKGAMSTRAVDLRLIEYFVCASYREGSNAPCEHIDRHLPPMSDDLHTCKALYQEGRMLKELAEGSGSTVECELDDRAWYGREEEGETAEGADLCAKSIPFLVRGDPEGYCRMLKDEHEGGEDDVVDERECRNEYIYFSGDPGRCSLTPYNFGRQERCRKKADLLRAVRQKAPSIVRSEFYAPLLEAGASCAGPRRRVLEEYQKK